MTNDERDRIERVESKVDGGSAKLDRVLTILDDPDFGLRYRVNDNTKRIKTLEMRVYGVMAGVITAFLAVAYTAVK